MAQAEHITTAIRELMSRGQPLKSTNRVRAAHTEFVAALAGNAPHPTRSDTNWEALEGRADHLEKTIAALHVYVTAIIDDEAALVRLWREKRGEAEPPDYSDNLIVQLGLATEPLNRRWYEKTTGQAIKDVQSWVRHPVIRWMAATLDGVVEGSGAVFEAKFMLPWSFSEEAAAEKHMPQLQHNMWVTNAAGAVLSIITGGGRWVEVKIPA